MVFIQLKFYLPFIPISCINAMNEFLSEMVLAGIGTPVVGPVLFHSTLYMLLLLDSKWRSALAPYNLLIGLDSGVILVVETPPY